MFFDTRPIELIGLTREIEAKSGQSLDGLLFPKQKEFIKDESKRKAAICSRRAGKSTGVSIDLAADLLKPDGADLAYITLTRQNAKKILAAPLQKLNLTKNLGLTYNKSDLTFVNDKTGKTLYLTGANTEDDVEKLRGLKLDKIVLDEVASFRANIINYAIEEVLEPTLIDTDGTMVLIGTPSANPTEDNIFYRATNGLEAGWSVHRWTLLDNPHIPHAKRWIDAYKLRKGWGDDHPIYLREWQGLWTFDSDSLVYKFKEHRNHFDTLPEVKFEYIMGVDLGFDDAFTISIVAFSYDHDLVFAVDEFKKSELIPAQMSEMIKKFQEKWKPLRIVADHGGLGKAICEEFRQRYGIPIHPAEKSKKLAYIELLNGDLISGTFKINKNSQLAGEMRLHQWDPDRPQKEDDRTPNDLCDANLYAWREAKHWLGERKQPRPPEGSFELAELINKELEEEEMQRYAKEQEELLYGEGY